MKNKLKQWKIEEKKIRSLQSFNTNQELELIENWFAKDLIIDKVKMKEKIIRDNLMYKVAKKTG